MHSKLFVKIKVQKLNLKLGIYKSTITGIYKSTCKIPDPW